METVRNTGFAGVGVLGRLIALGAGLWAVGVLGIHCAAPFGVLGAAWAAPVLALGVAGAWGCVRLVERVGGIGRARLLEAVALTCMPALMLDGVALTWAPQIYSARQGEQHAAAGCLLWFVGVSLAIAVFKGGRQADPGR
jgi:hypothetical protein